MRFLLTVIALIIIASAVACKGEDKIIGRRPDPTDSSYYFDLSSVLPENWSAFDPSERGLNNEELGNGAVFSETAAYEFHMYPNQIWMYMTIVSGDEKTRVREKLADNAVGFEMVKEFLLDPIRTSFEKQKKRTGEPYKLVEVGRREEDVSVGDVGKKLHLLINTDLAGIGYPAEELEYEGVIFLQKLVGSQESALVFVAILMEPPGESYGSVDTFDLAKEVSNRIHNR